MIVQTKPAALEDPVCGGIFECTFRSERDNTLQTFLIKDYRSQDSPAGSTAVIYLHGSGSHQEQGMTRGIYGGAFERWGEEFARRKVIHVCPEYRGNSWMGPAAVDDVRQIIRLISARFGPSRVILFGGSMGGTSALIFACFHPELVESVIALCPASDPAEMYPAFSQEMAFSYGGSPDEKPEEYQARRTRDRVGLLAGKAIAIVHGEADLVITVGHSRTLVHCLQKTSANLRYREIPGGDHDSPVQACPRELMRFVMKEEN